jgi:hypothetical protein
MGLPNQVVVAPPGEIAFRPVTLPRANHCQCSSGWEKQI